MSRIHRIGNIYSRVEGLIRKGQIQEENRPLWFDLYQRFPPKYEPCETRKPPEVNVREILYEEDRLRAKIHKELNMSSKIFYLTSTRETPTQKLLKTCQEYVSQGMSEDEAVEKLKNENVTPENTVNK